MQVELSTPAYNQSVKLRNWSCRVTARHCHCPKTAAKLIQRFAPSLTRDQHAAIAQYHAHRATRLKTVWNQVAERAAQDAFGRAWEFADYKISGIGRDEFSDTHKRVLRHCAHRSGEHQSMQLAHEILAKANRHIKA